jgi:hypothetical protein
MSKAPAPRRGGVQITVETAGTSPEERRRRISHAVDTGLRVVAGDPEMRLQMILGEAYARQRELLDWLAGEIEKDEVKAPGLRELARRVARNESVAGLNALGSRDMAQIKRGLLVAAGMDRPPKEIESPESEEETDG